MSQQLEALRRISASHPKTTLTTSVRQSVGVNADVEVRVTASAWVKLGDNTVAATKGTANETLVTPEAPLRINSGSSTDVAIIEETGGAKASVTIFKKAGDA